MDVSKRKELGGDKTLCTKPTFLSKQFVTGLEDLLNKLATAQDSDTIRLVIRQKIFFYENRDLVYLYQVTL